MKKEVKVAFIQNRVQAGGRFQVMGEMIKLLNERGIVPDILCFRSALNKAKVGDFYGQELEFNIKLINQAIPMPFEWNIYWFNIKVNRALKNYGLVINHNNTSFGLNFKGRILNYIHFPRKWRLQSGLSDIHLPEKGKIPIINYRKDLLNIMKRLYHLDRLDERNEKLLANSKFTAAKTVEVYPELNAGKIEILYPPVDCKILYESDKIRKNQILSLGRISPQKRQLEQLRIASLLPEFEFCIVGFIGNESYYKRCREFIEERKLNNVKIIPNAQKNELQQLKSESKYFIHSMQMEPFGITSVQAIAAGCLPVVHNSGGQKEVVNMEELRYNNPEEAVEIFQKLLKITDSEISQKVKALQEHIQKFDVENFRDKFRKILMNELN